MTAFQSLYPSDFGKRSAVSFSLCVCACVRVCVFSSCSHEYRNYPLSETKRRHLLNFHARFLHPICICPCFFFFLFLSRSAHSAPTDSELEEGKGQRRTVEHFSVENQTYLPRKPAFPRFQLQYLLLHSSVEASLHTVLPKPHPVLIHAQDFSADSELLLGFSSGDVLLFPEPHKSTTSQLQYHCIISRVLAFIFLSVCVCA